MSGVGGPTIPLFHEGICASCDVPSAGNNRKDRQNLSGTDTMFK